MIVITTPLGVAGLLGIAYLSVLFANLSRRLIAVTKMADHCRWFHIAAVLLVLAALSQIIRSIAGLAPDLALAVLREPWFALLSFHTPVALGITIDLMLVWHYWSWILKEKIR
jgi:hypothetical protein